MDTRQNLIDDLELAVSVAKDAGQLLETIRAGVDHDAASKDELNELRNRADEQANEQILAKLKSARPGDGILSEEAKDSADRLSDEHVWIIDPLDGTWEYGQGRPDCGVHVALYETSTTKLLLGVVDLPAQSLTRTSMDPDPQLPAVPTDRPIRVVASRTRPPKNLDAIVAQLGNQLKHNVEIVNVGSVGAKVNEILLGNAEVYLHDTGFYEWDLAAPMAVAQHYGLWVSHWDGSNITFNHMPPYVPNVVVSHPKLRDEVFAAIEAVQG